MTETVHEYVTDDSIDEDAFGDMLCRHYEASYDAVRGEVTIDAKHDSFTGIVLAPGVEGDSVGSDRLDDVSRWTVELEKIESDIGNAVEYIMKREEAMSQQLPLEYAYLYHDGDGYDQRGVRMWCDIDGDTYGFESVYTDEMLDSGVDSTRTELEQHLRTMREQIWSDKIHDHRTNV